MPSFSFSQALTANQLGFNPLIQWQFERVPWPAAVKLLVRATANSVRLTVYTGSTTIQERSPVQGGGTAGTLPSELNTTPIVWMASGGDKLKLQFDEVSGLTPTVDGVIIVEPM
ncbi:MAG: hypothetical protein L0214_15000 [candidate division NC10 bacterium]|nr:hypothetical protein [candidate division NC10 bacterium]